LKAGEVALPAGRALGPAELGLAAAMGFAALPVRRFPRVALMSTGDELVEVGDEPGPGQIVDSNRFALLGALSEAGAEVRLLGIAPDDPERLRALVEEALVNADVLVPSGASSRCRASPSPSRHGPPHASPSVCPASRSPPW